MSFYLLMYVLGSLLFGAWHCYKHWERVQRVAQSVIGHRAEGKYVYGLYIGATIGSAISWPWLAFIVVRHHVRGAHRRYDRWRRWRRLPARAQRIGEIVCLAAVARKLGEDMARIASGEMRSLRDLEKEDEMDRKALGP